MYRVELNHELSTKYFFTIEDCGEDYICNFGIINEIVPLIQHIDIIYRYYGNEGVEYDVTNKIKYINYNEECKKTGINIDRYRIEWNERVDVVFKTEEDAFYFKLKYT